MEISWKTKNESTFFLLNQTEYPKKKPFLKEKYKKEKKEIKNPNFEKKKIEKEQQPVGPIIKTFSQKEPPIQKPTIQKPLLEKKESNKVEKKVIEKKVEKSETILSKEDQKLDINTDFLSFSPCMYFSITSCSS